MIQALVKTTGWAADKPRETLIYVAEDAVAYEQIQPDKTKTPVTYWDLYKAFKDRRNYVKENAGYEASSITVESFENWFFAKYMPKGLVDRLISIEYSVV